MSVRIDLQDGFRDDSVSVDVDGKQVAHAERVTTRLQTGFAASLTVDVGAAQATLGIAVPTRNLSITVDWRTGDPAHLGCSVARDGKTLTLRRSHEPFGYV